MIIIIMKKGIQDALKINKLVFLVLGNRITGLNVDLSNEFLRGTRLLRILIFAALIFIVMF